MANEEQLEMLRQGIAHWNEWRKQHQGTRPDLRNANLLDADLRDANLKGADLSRANLICANLYHANLSSARLRHADLSSANLSGANLSRANLYRADLGGARLRHADLSSANLRRANLNTAHLNAANLTYAELKGANLSRALMWETIVARVDLRETKGLVEINHRGPSCIELHTVQLPQDRSALHFLHGAGVPDEWIDDYRAHLEHPVEYHSCFISYSSEDETLARRLHTDLQANGVRCWFAPEDMKIGEKIRSRIDAAVHVHEKLLLLLSEHSIESDWVEVEVEAALEKEQKQRGEVLFPVRLDESVMQTLQAWAAMLRRTRHIGDFTNWPDPQAYEHAFQRLLRDLKKTDGEMEGGRVRAQLS